MKMDYKKILEVNYMVLDKALKEVEKARVTGTYDCEDMEAFSMAIDNIKDILEIEEMHKEKDLKASKEMHFKETDSDFINKSYEVIKKWGYEEGLTALLKVLNELMTDLDIMYPQIYIKNMEKIKLLLK